MGNCGAATINNDLGKPGDYPSNIIDNMHGNSGLPLPKNILDALRKFPN